MIQRIQTLYMLLAVAAMAVCFMFPVATFDTPTDLPQTMDGELWLVPSRGAVHSNVGGIEMTLSQSTVFAVWPLTALVAVAACCTLVSIFMYKNRIRQMRFVMLPFLLMVVYLFLIFIWAVDNFVETATMPLSDMGQGVEVHTVYGIGAWASVAALLLLFLANRAIKKDEAKVRAADRLR